MFIHLSSLVPWLLRYKYFVIFPIAVIEGPIITIICGFLASLGFLNLLAAYVLIVTGDLTGDTLYYLIGKFGREKFLKKFGHFIGLTLERVEKLEKHFEAHPKKTFAFGKIMHGPGTTVLVAAGLAKVPYRTFLLGNILPTMAKSLLLILAGYYFGSAYLKFNSYLNYAALSFTVLAGVLLLIYFYRSRSGKDPF
jgi:membrane-associated protein